MPLCLTRREGDSITINDNVEVIILKIKGNQCRVLIKAPEDTAVNRTEMLKKNIKDDK